MKTLGNLYLVWRAGKEKSRIAIGILRKNQTGGVRFSYIEGIEKAKKEGFVPFAEFPDTDTKKIYTENVIDFFGQRLNTPEGDDAQKYDDFWEINPAYKTDKFYLLARTQGVLPTDNLEFLADYNPVINLKFTSEICELNVDALSPNMLYEGELLRWKYDRKSQHKSKDISIFKGSLRLGSLKLIHCNVFSKLGGKKLLIKVKHIDKNGSINRVFITVYMP